MFKTLWSASARRVRQCALFAALLVLLADVAQAAFQQDAFLKDSKANSAENANAFGKRISKFGNYLLVAAPQFDTPQGAASDGLAGYAENDNGIAYIYHRSGSQWTLQTDLRDAVGTLRYKSLVPGGDLHNNQFGESVDMNDDYAFVHTVVYNSNGGPVFVFKRNGATWEYLQALNKSFTSGDRTFWKRHSHLSLDRVNGDWLFVDDYAGTDKQVSIFKRNAATGLWDKHSFITKTDAAITLFGYSVAVSGTYAVVGNDSHSALIYEYDGSAWVLKKNIINSADGFGCQVAITADGIAVVGSRSGSFHYYTRNSGNWDDVNSVAPAGFQTSCPMMQVSNTRIVVSQADAQSGYGRVWIFDKDAAGAFPTTASQTIDGNSTNKHFGRSISLDGDELAVGAYDTDTSIRGYAFVYGQPTCAVNQHAAGGVCSPCPTGRSNAAGDLITDVTTCDECAENYFSTGSSCEPCADGHTNTAGDVITNGPTSCGVCDANYYVDGTSCVACPGSSTNVAGDAISGGNTACDGDLCVDDQYVLNHRCVSCDLGYSRSAGDDKAGGNTSCDACAQDYFVDGSGCVACPAGTTNVAGDVIASGNSACDGETCGENEYVSGHRCVTCAVGTSRVAGDLTSGTDTTCDACAEGYSFDGTNCVACATGYSRAAGDLTTGSAPTTTCDTCAEGYNFDGTNCVACATGYSRAAGDLTTGSATTCDTCVQDHYVDAGACLACPTGTTNAAGDDVALGNTACDGEVCGEDEYVSGYRCVACAAGYSRTAGDLKNGTDTTCDADPPPPVAASPSSYVEASLDLTGYTAATFTEAAQTTFRTGVATLLDVDLSDVVIVSVSDVTSSRRRRLMQASSGAVRVAFRVTASASQLSSISSQLSSASSSGALLTALQTAGLSNATGLSLQSVDAVYESESARRAALAKDAIAGIAAGSSAFAILVFLCMRRNAKRRAARVQQIIASQGGLPQGAHGRGYQPYIVHMAPNAGAPNAQTVDAIALQRANSAARQAARKDAMDRQKQRVERQLRK